MAIMSSLELGALKKISHSFMVKLFLKRMNAFYLNIFLHPSHLWDFSTVFDSHGHTHWAQGSKQSISHPEIKPVHTSLVAQLVKNLPAMWETWVRSLGWEDPLKKGKATHSSILAWRIPWSPWGHKESDIT